MNWIAYVSMAGQAKETFPEAVYKSIIRVPIFKSPYMKHVVTICDILHNHKI